MLKQIKNGGAVVIDKSHKSLYRTPISCIEYFNSFALMGFTLVFFTNYNFLMGLPTYKNIIIANNVTNDDRANGATLVNIYASGGGKNIKVHDNVGSGTGYPFITFKLGDFDKQTVKLEHNRFEYVKDAGWINKAERYITSINSRPDYVGQMVIVGGNVYIATGTTANTDWKLVSNQTTV